MQIQNVFGKQLNGDGVSIAATQVPTADFRHGGWIVQLLVVIVQTLLFESPRKKY